MKSKTKIIVLHMKEIIYTIIFAALGIVRKLDASAFGHTRRAARDFVCDDRRQHQGARQQSNDANRICRSGWAGVQKCNSDCGVRKTARGPRRGNCVGSEHSREKPPEAHCYDISCIHSRGCSACLRDRLGL